jgi:hypothetical protein
MNTRSKYILLTLALALLAPLMRSQTLTPESIPPPAIPQPLAAMQEAGQYVSLIENLQQLSKEKRYIEFYKEASDALEIAGGKRKKIQRTVLSKEEQVAWEWISYLQLTAPLLSHEQIEKATKKRYQNDFLSKIVTLERLCGENTLEVANVLGFDQNRLLKHRVETITESLRFFRKLSVYAEDTKVHEKEDKLPVPVEEPEDAWPFSGVRLESGTVEFPRQIRRFAMRNDIRNMLSKIVDDYVRKLVACFPKQQETIKEYMRKAGLGANECYSEEFHFAVQFRNAVGRRPETAWLFRGLPSEEAVKADGQRRIRESRERAERIMVEMKLREKREAEALAKRKAEEAREAQRREAEIKRREAAQAKPSDPPNPDNPPKP